MAITPPPLDPADVWGADLNAVLEQLDTATEAAQADADAAAAAAAAAQADADAAATSAGNAIPKGDITAIDVVTQAEYDALDPKLPTTLYVIQG
jgi:hypothetical protein